MNGMIALLRTYESKFHHDLADALEQNAKQIADLQRELDNERAREVHSCSPDCTRAGCVNHLLRAQIEELAAALASKDEALQAAVTWIDNPDARDRAAIASALQPHASLVAKIKAEAVRDVVRRFVIIPSTQANAILNYAKVTEQGVKQCD